MRSIELCAGMGGGLLGNLLLGHTTICAVEIEPSCQTVLRARQAQGFLPEFPIYDDARKFDGRPWRGSVDVLSGGIPCQGFSGAGKQLGEFDPRNLWPDALRILKECRAPWFFLENVDRLTSFDYWGVILQDLASAGYDARWCVLSAGDVGAPHLRKRIWLLATDTDAFRGQGGERSDADVQRGRTKETEQVGMVDSGERPRHMANPNGIGSKQGGETGDMGGAEVGYQGASGQREWVRDASFDCGSEVAIGWSGRDREPDPKPNLGGGIDGVANQLDVSEWWSVERGLPRVVEDEPESVERLRGCGNGQVALCKAVAWRLLGGP